MRLFYDYAKIIGLITKIVMENIEENINLLPKNITKSTVIHLRLGDVIAGNEWHEKAKRPLDVNHIKSLLIGLQLFQSSRCSVTIKALHLIIRHSFCSLINCPKDVPL